MASNYRNQPWNKPVWEILKIPQSELNTITAFCPHCQYHTAWAKAKGFVSCAWCFKSIILDPQTEQKLFPENHRPNS